MMDAGAASAEAEGLFQQFITHHQYKDANAFISYINCLKQMHIEDGCSTCVTGNEGDEQSLLPSSHDDVNGGDETAVKAAEPRKSDRRKSRKSVCVQKLDFSFSDSEDDDNDNDGDDEVIAESDDNVVAESDDNVVAESDGVDEVVGESDFDDDVDKDGAGESGEARNTNQFVDMQPGNEDEESDDEVFINRGKKTFKNVLNDDNESSFADSPVQQRNQLVDSNSSDSEDDADGSEDSEDRDFINDNSSEESTKSLSDTGNNNVDSSDSERSRRKDVPKKVNVIEDSSDDSDSNFDNFLQSCNQPKTTKAVTIDVSSDDDFISSPHTTTKTPKQSGNTNMKTPKTTGGIPYPAFKTPKSTFKTPRSSLGNVLHRFPDVQPRTPKYKLHFNKQRDDLIKDLFALYNRTVFENKLPADFQISWNKRMTKTAGFCYLKTTPAGRVSHVELSTKVVDTIERLRDTLIHELCHAATWIFEGKRGHGVAWKYWAKKANKIHPELSKITTCHTYDIETKYKYQCEGCGVVFGRHTKSIDDSKHACAKCGGRPLLLSVSGASVSDSTPRKPNAYSEYVKKHYSRIKWENPDVPSRDVMKLVAEDFRAFKLSETEDKENIPCS